MQRGKRHFLRVGLNAFQNEPGEFARRVAATINFTGTHEKLTPALLEAEFNRMDMDGDGVLSKKEMHAFMGDKMDDRDFEAMFAAIDPAQKGMVGFILNNFGISIVRTQPFPMLEVVNLDALVITDTPI